jgi:hypothetical protein
LLSNLLRQSTGLLPWTTRQCFYRGPKKNGSNCCTCNRMFHDVCLHVFDGDIYCTKCFKTNVV